jgi:hypothetical protein
VDGSFIICGLAGRQAGRQQHQRAFRPPAAAQAGLQAGTSGAGGAGGALTPQAQRQAGGSARQRAVHPILLAADALSQALQAAAAAGSGQMKVPAEASRQWPKMRQLQAVQRNNIGTQPPAGHACNRGVLTRRRAACTQANRPGSTRRRSRRLWRRHLPPAPGWRRTAPSAPQCAQVRARACPAAPQGCLPSWRPPRQTARLRLGCEVGQPGGGQRQWSAMGQGRASAV